SHRLRYCHSIQHDRIRSKSTRSQIRSIRRAGEHSHRSCAFRNERRPAMKRHWNKMGQLLGLLFALTLCAAAQEEPNLERGFQPYRLYQGGNIDTINFLNGNVTVKMELWRTPERGGAIDVDNFFLYNSKTYEVQQYCDATSACEIFWSQRVLGVGISNSLAVGMDWQNVVMGIDGNGQPSLWDAIDAVHTPDDASIILANFPHGGFCGGPCPTVAGARAANGTGWLLTSSDLLYDASGVLYSGASGISTGSRADLLNNPMPNCPACLQSTNAGI